MSNPVDYERRALLVAGSAASLGLAGCSGGSAMKLETIPQALQFIDKLRTQKASVPGEWSIAQVLEHCAQSIDFSIKGFPQAKSRLFQSTAGAVAFAVFKARDQMSHSLVEPIPGAAPLVESDVAQGADRLVASFAAFEAHKGDFKPHFAYGALSRAEYVQAHLMHLANHFSVMTFT
jgi:Protein of unknown function (DUF1569)